MIDYTGLNIWQVQELDLDLYLFFMREAFIHEIFDVHAHHIHHLGVIVTPE